LIHALKYCRESYRQKEKFNKIDTLSLDAEADVAVEVAMVREHFGALAT
jgi:hypothetical protein